MIGTDWSLRDGAALVALIALAVALFTGTTP